MDIKRRLKKIEGLAKKKASQRKELFFLFCSDGDEGKAEKALPPERPGVQQIIYSMILQPDSGRKISGDVH